MLGYEINMMATPEYEEWSASAASGTLEPELHWSDMTYFVETGGLLLQSLLFNAMIEASSCINVPIPPLRDATHGRVSRRTRQRSRWAARQKRKDIQAARDWVVDEMPGIWRTACKSDPAHIIKWLTAVWPTCDADQRYATRIQRMLRSCIIREQTNG